MVDIEWNIADHAHFLNFAHQGQYKLQLIAHKCHANEQQLDIEIVCL